MATDVTYEEVLKQYEIIVTGMTREGIVNKLMIEKLNLEIETLKQRVNELDLPAETEVV